MGDPREPRSTGPRRTAPSSSRSAALPSDRTENHIQTTPDTTLIAIRDYVVGLELRTSDGTVDPPHGRGRRTVFSASSAVRPRTSDRWWPEPIPHRRVVLADDPTAAVPFRRFCGKPRVHPHAAGASRESRKPHQVAHRRSCHRGSQGAQRLHRSSQCVVTQLRAGYSNFSMGGHSFSRSRRTRPVASWRRSPMTGPSPVTTGTSRQASASPEIAWPRRVPTPSSSHRPNRIWAAGPACVELGVHGWSPTRAPWRSIPVHRPSDPSGPKVSSRVVPWRPGRGPADWDGVRHSRQEKPRKSPLRAQPGFDQRFAPYPQTTLT